MIDDIVKKISKLPKNKQEKYLNKYNKETLKRTSVRSNKMHIIKHAKEIYTKDATEWVASMRNMIDVFEMLHHVKATPIIRIKKMIKKYNKNTKRYSPPPKI